MSRRGIHPLIRGLNRPPLIAPSRRPVPMSGLESAQRKRYLRSEAEEAEASQETLRHRSFHWGDVDLQQAAKRHRTQETSLPSWVFFMPFWISPTLRAWRWLHRPHQVPMRLQLHGQGRWSCLAWTVYGRWWRQPHSRWCLLASLWPSCPRATGHGLPWGVLLKNLTTGGCVAVEARSVPRSPSDKRLWRCRWDPGCCVRPWCWSPAATSSTSPRTAMPTKRWMSSQCWRLFWLSHGCRGWTRTLQRWRHGHPGC